ncbi:pentatricopeptide repeat-containing protein-like [Dorcoceras hygrometricum]|uniref:Pentatricopeptide repeat-containing protein-like n=1 Tax=Dorcoceras hygrometricum TaxID=472368 RepID=A0A2Z7AEP5_9LAMI|nr:pentatricopeptide repeat-containing protein-like [Dorcoceras hygrometricum]
MVFVSPSRKLIPPSIRAAIATPKLAIFQEDRLPFIPFSQLQEIKLLESQLIATLDNSINLVQVKQNHAYIIRRGLHQSSYIIAKLLRMLSKVNEPMRSYGVSVFSQVKFPNAFLYAALIRGFTIDGLFKESVLVYNSMRRDGIKPLSFTFSALLKACGTETSSHLGRQLHGESVKLGGFELDLFLGNGLIDMYVKCGWLDYGRKIFDEMPERDLISWTSLIVGYAKDGDLRSAVELFHALPVKDMVAWTAMVTGFVQNGKPREAMQYFERMQNAGVETDEVTLVGVINACAQVGMMRYGNWIREVAHRSGFDPSNNVLLGSALIDMYSKCGSVDDAYAVFKSMNNLNVYSYSSMIVGLASHGHGNSAIGLFKEMVKTDVKPNAVTFIGVLAACSHAGLVEQGRSYFEMMEKTYGVKQSVDHYNCMVDLFSRTGRLDEALDLIRSMKMEPSAGIWGALLGGCRMYANPHIAEVAARHLFKIEPDNIGNYILLAQVYAKSERWKDVLEVRKLIREKGFKKYPAFSWVEGEKGVIHEFHAGELTHPRSKEIKEALEDIFNRLKSIGYVPNFSSVLYDLGEDERRQILMHHSEKLAFAYGLLTTDNGCAIRIMKNLRICEDCHSFMCGTSQITGREIIVRDNMRFHRFLVGKCSCSNFW